MKNLEKIRKKMKDEWDRDMTKEIEKVKKEGPISEKEAFDIDARMARIWEKQEEDLMDRMLNVFEKRKEKKNGKERKR
jgi:hypothetical protein